MSANASSRAACDVVILGGGPAGCATALSLAQCGVSPVVLVETTRYQGMRVGESVPPETGNLLNQLGLWDDFLKENHEPCFGSCSSWGSDALGYNDFLFNAFGNGWHLDRIRFDEFLAGKAAQRGTDIRTATRLQACERLGESDFRLRLVGDDGQAITISTAFIVDATGMRSCFARRMGARRRFFDQLLCLVEFFELPDPSRFSQLTMLEAVEYGWWYAAKLPNGRLAVAMASDPQIIKQSGLQRRDRWLDHLAATNHLAREVSGCRLLADRRITCAAPSFLSDAVVGNGWLAVGDAASSFDPISSQGIHKALADGVLAGEAIATFLRGNDDDLDEYRSSVASRFQHYLDQRNYFYGLEQRWPASAFWMRRRSKPAH